MRNTENLIKQFESILKRCPCVNYKAWMNSSEALRVHLNWRSQKNLSYNYALNEKSISSWRSETIKNMTVTFEKTSGSESKGIMTNQKPGKKVSVSLRIDSPTRLQASKGRLPKCWTKMSHWLKKYVCCFRIKALQSLPFPQLLECPWWTESASAAGGGGG